MRDITLVDREFAIMNDLEFVKQLNSDEEAVEIVRELVIDNYIETIKQDLLQNDSSLLYAFLSGEGLKPISELSEQELILEALELNIFKNISILF